MYVLTPLHLSLIIYFTWGERRELLWLNIVLCLLYTCRGKAEVYWGEITKVLTGPTWHSWCQLTSSHLVLPTSPQHVPSLFTHSFPSLRILHCFLTPQLYNTVSGRNLTLDSNADFYFTEKRGSTEGNFHMISSILFIPYFPLYS